MIRLQSAPARRRLEHTFIYFGSEAKSMDVLSAFGMAYPIGLGIAAFGAGLGLGKAVNAALEGTARQPEASGKILISMIIGGALIEALAIYALAAPFVAKAAGVFGG